MARIAAKHVQQQDTAVFAGADMSTKLKLMGVDVASVGDAHAMTPNAVSYFYADEDALIYKKLVVDQAKTKVLGAVLVGDATEYSELLQMMLNGLPLPEQPESLIMPGFSQGAAKAGGSGVDLLPDSATICSCNNVSKALLAAAPMNAGSSEGPLVCSCFKVGKNRILETIKTQNITHEKQVTACLKAGGNCGSCLPEIRGLIKSCQQELAHD